MVYPKIIGSQIIRLTSVDSTNNFVLGSMAGESYPEGTIVMAIEQFAGQGLEHNKWESEKGKNLTFSVILYPVFLQPAEQFMLNKAVSLAIADVVREYLPTGPVRVKWPNDVYIRDNKVAGILINNTIRGNHFDHSIVGIGMNVNQRKFLSDAPNPVSLNNYLNETTDLEECLHKLSSSLNFRYNQLRMGKKDQLDDEYLENLYRLGKSTEFRVGKELFHARIQGVSEYGQLILQKESGETAKYEFKEVEFVI